ncbi:MAG: class I SAM-dependent methyltransferase [Neisseria sp.]|nr:class I SAM-dependent methyltransferase [Neisseria sp.]
MAAIPFISRQAAPETLERAAAFGLRPSESAAGGVADGRNLPRGSLYLLADECGIALAKAGEKGVVRVDFTGGAAQYRRTKGGGELIAKAVNHAAKPLVWDATGGLGRDSFVLAAQGLQVCTFERHPIVALLLSDGLARAVESEDAETAEIARRITLVQGNAAEMMADFAVRNGRPDVVYLDPMYPVRQKSAAVKKEMAYFHDLVGEAAAEDDAALLVAAKAAAKKRVVVKRPRLGEWLANEEPAYQYGGKSIRFDVYLPDFPVSAGVQTA